MKRTVLVAAVAVAVLGLGTLGALTANAEPTYIGATKCKMCHKIEYDSWAQTKHAKATEDAKASKTMKFEAACLTCHATNKDEALAGVQCEACHGAGSEYKSLSVMKDLAKAKAAGLIIPTQATCNSCHDGKDHHKSQKFNPDVHAHKAKM
jgi:RecJ-like exonuclease